MPQKNVEFIVPTSAGSTMDCSRASSWNVAERQQAVTTITVQAKPGARRRRRVDLCQPQHGDGHFIAISGPTLLANDVLGVGDLKYKDVTPIAQLFTEYEVFAVTPTVRSRPAQTS